MCGMVDCIERVPTAHLKYVPRYKTIRRIDSDRACSNIVTKILKRIKNITSWLGDNNGVET